MDTINIKKDILRQLLSYWSSVIARLGTTGNQWALRVTSVNSSGVSITGVTETPSMASYATNTTIAAGAKSVTIITDSSFAGTILGATATADSVYTFTASAGNTLAAIAVTRSAGNFTVLKTV